MAKTNYSSVDEYVAAQPAAAQEVLRRVRATLRMALPGADEGISYQIPTYKLHGAAVIYFAGWKEHFSLYPVTAAVQERFGAELGARVVSKGTIRFPLAEPVPVRLIAGIAKARAREELARQAAKAKTGTGTRVVSARRRATTAATAKRITAAAAAARKR